MRDSFDRGRAATEYPEGRPTMAEGLEGAVSPRTFAICREALADIVLAKEPAIARAMARAYRELGLVLEASAAVTIAALAEGLVDAGGGRVLCIATGSNVDAEVLDAALASEG
jgi:threonine dehydratase